MVSTLSKADNKLSTLMILLTVAVSFLVNVTSFQVSTIACWHIGNPFFQDDSSVVFCRSSSFLRGRNEEQSTSQDKDDVANGLDNLTQQLQIAFITGNEMKAREMQLILDKHGATRGEEDAPSLVQLRVVKVDLPEIQEIDTQAIAKQKALQGAQLAGGPCVVEDTSLQFHALGGMPGPFIKWFQEKLGSTGLHKILSDYEDKSATAVCTLAFCPYPHADPVLFTGETEGQIVPPCEGQGFGWDSIFVPDEADKPFSQMSTDEKNGLSHRGKAVRLWADWLGKNKDELFRRQTGVRAVGHKGLDFKSISSEQ